MTYYSIELIDINENIENFKFNKISEKDLKLIKDSFKFGGSDGIFEFSCLEGEILLQNKFFRGIMYSSYREPQKTAIEETLEDSIEVSKLDLPRRG